MKNIKTSSFGDYALYVKEILLLKALLFHSHKTLCLYLKEHRFCNAIDEQGEIGWNRNDTQINNDCRCSYWWALPTLKVHIASILFYLRGKTERRLAWKSALTWTKDALSHLFQHLTQLRMTRVDVLPSHIYTKSET